MSFIFIPNDFSYNEQGQLIVKGEIKNTLDYRTANLWVIKLEIFNENNDLIASNCFGYIYVELRFDPLSSHDATFVFPSITVSIKDDDLDKIKAVIETSSSVEYYDSFIVE